MALIGSHELLKVCMQAPKHVLSTHVHVPAVDCWFELAGYYLAVKKGIWGGIILKDVMQLLQFLVDNDYREVYRFLEQSLSKLEGTVQFMIINEGEYGSGPFDAYSTAYEKSISWLSLSLVRRILASTGNDKDRLLGVLVEINKAIWGHFRNVVEKVEFGGSFLLWHITETIKDIVLGLLQILKRSDEDVEQWREKLLMEVGWILSPLEFVFYGSKNLKQTQVKKICDTFCWIGLEYYDGGFQGTAVDAVLRIESIVGIYCGANKTLSKFEIADLMMHIWYLRVFVESTGREDVLLKRLDGAMGKPASLSEEMWEKVSSTLELRKGQLITYLNRLERYVLPMDSRGILKSLLTKAARESDGDRSVDPPEKNPTDESSS